MEQTKVFEAADLLRPGRGHPPAPESSHAITDTIPLDEQLAASPRPSRRSAEFKIAKHPRTELCTGMLFIFPFDEHPNAVGSATSVLRRARSPRRNSGFSPCILYNNSACAR